MESQLRLFPRDPNSSLRRLGEDFKTMTSHLKETKEFLESKLNGFKPEVALVVGSGLTGITQGVANPIVVPYTATPYFPKPTVAGHAGQMIFGMLAGKKLMVLSGRFHYYE